MSLASVKKRLQPGQELQMVRHDWSPDGKPATKISGVRQVIKTQSNAVQFSGGSWLYFPPASRVRETAKGFQVDLGGDGKFAKVMEYEWR